MSKLTETLALATIATLAMLASGCNSSNDVFDDFVPDDAEWALAVDSLLTTAIIDPAGDYDPSEPTYQVDFQSVDLLSMAFGADGGYLYIRLDFSGAIPEAPVVIPANGDIEQQTVSGQSISFVMDTDNNNATGAGAQNFHGNGGMEGVDIFFGIGFSYGAPMNINANYDFMNNDIHLHQGQIIGEFGAGGPGHAFVIYRFDISSLDSRFWPAGSTVEVGGWAEAESDLYHEFVNDFLVPINWTLPQ